MRAFTVLYSQSHKFHYIVVSISQRLTQLPLLTACHFHLVCVYKIVTHNSYVCIYT